MASYEYKALDKKGNIVKGVIEGDHDKSARSLLRAQGLAPTFIQAVSAEKSSRLYKRAAKIPFTNLSILTRQLSTLFLSGLTVEGSLNAVMKQAKGIKLKKLLSDIRSLINEGYSLTQAISCYPRTFADIYVSSVSAGEESGNLGEVMDRLSDYLESRHSAQQKISTALIYPIFLLISSLCIVVSLVAYVVPKVVSVFQDTGQTLPLMTRALIYTSDILQNYWLFILLSIFITVMLCHYSLKMYKIKYRFHQLCLELIGIGSFIRSVNTSRMARTLAIMVGSGVPLITSMQSAVGVLSNLVLKHDLQIAIKEVSEGVSMSRALDKAGNFPVLLIQMIASGENSGQLSHMLEKSASVTESETESRLTMFVSLFEPVMILLMGVIVLVIVLAILLPIFNLNQVLV